MFFWHLVFFQALLYVGVSQSEGPCRVLIITSIVYSGLEFVALSGFPLPALCASRCMMRKDGFLRMSSSFGVYL